MACGFYLDKTCAEAPSELAHPFHHNHNLNLLSYYMYEGFGFGVCDFCNRRCRYFVYHCSCGLDFHIQCALFSFNIAEKKIGELQIPNIDPLLSTETPSKKLKEAQCFACWKPLLDSAYLSLASGFHLHKKCLELPLKINHLCHREHSLSLQFNSERLPCQICQETQRRGFVYCCSSCKFVIHIACVSPTPTIKGEIHEHPFTLFWRLGTFTCDACGTMGDFASYICSACSFTIHENCISLPPTIRIGRHRHHSLSHTFILGQHEFTTWECKLCPKEVNPQHGGYCCFDCSYIVHTNCGKKESSWYIFDKKEESDDFEQFNKKSAFSVIKEAKLGENVVATEIKHLSHQRHNLVLSDHDDIKDEKFCDGCMLFISTAFYYCSICNFFLHKSCAELPRKTYLWFLKTQSPCSLIFGHIFVCDICDRHFNIGFGYENKHDEFEFCFCLRCALTSDMPTCGGHQHRLTYYDKYKGQCNGCGGKRSWGFACKDCNFLVDGECLMLPNIIQHKCDEHPLKLTYGDPNVYSEHNYCDICEERRNPNLWFYHCASCDTSVHPNCVVGRYSFLKLGLSYKYEDHPHPLTLTQKVYDYPDQCHECEEPCLDAALECKEKGCNYILHWGCVEDKSFLALEGSN
ncbi:Zinc finger, PHD-type [Corchorus olitorius]|uniref:Zinc finger, PHD-type n=1 Tax=Corchorus olitorius TaxID=93759 RepID=A0A1R3I029_9ROSI|nr:Zinc finger, PHD-type [Corchorus olitorius]